MKNMKRFACAIAALTALLMQPHPVLAVFKGTVRGDLPLTFEIQPANANTNPTDVTITFIDYRGRPDIEMLTFEVGAGEANIHVVSIPRGTRRIVMQVDNPVGGTCLFKMTQGVNSFGDPIKIIEEAVIGDIRFTLNVLSARSDLAKLRERASRNPQKCVKPTHQMFPDQVKSHHHDRKNDGKCAEGKCRDLKMQQAGDSKTDRALYERQK